MPRFKLLSALLALSLFAAPVGAAATDEDTPDQKVRVLVLDPTGPKFSVADRRTFAGLIGSSLARWPIFDVLTTQDMKKAVDLAAQRQLLGCASDACLADVAGIADAQLVVFGDVNRLGKLLIINLNLFDSAANKSVGRVSVEAPSVELLPSFLRQQTDELVKDAISEYRARGNASSECPPNMVRIPAGQFFMGADEDDKDPLLKNAKPSHNVTLDAFCIDRYEVTVADYKHCTSTGKCRRASRTVSWPNLKPESEKLYSPLCNGNNDALARHPINCIDWRSAKRYCEAQGARLPTEAEWEFATRGPDGRRYPWGDDKPTAHDLNACGTECAAWAKAHGTKAKTLYNDDDKFPLTSPVGSFPAGASRFGPEDVVGNVWEWVADWYGPYGAADVENPVGPAKGQKRVVRGGAFNGSFDSWVRPAYRFSAPVDQRSHAIGFRCARTLAPEE